jgi:DNA-binding CsgD family transcriptional regulator
MQTPTFVEDFVFGSSPSESITWLLQQLLQCNGTVGVTINNQRPADAETILALDMDGFHYTLTRRCAEQSMLKSRLSPREQEIVCLVAKGYANKSIAKILNISSCTVATHIRRIFDKLHAKSRAEMVAQAFEYRSD